MNLFVYREGYQRRRESANGRSYASRLPVLLLVRVLMNLLSLPLRHAQRINTSFRLVNTNQQSPDSGDFVVRKFQCKVTRPFFSPNIKEKEWSGYARLLTYLEGLKYTPGSAAE